MQPNKNLLYVTVYGKIEYIKLFNLFFMSLALHYDGMRGTTLLIMTSVSFEESIRKTISSFSPEIEILIWSTEEKPTVREAALARYQIFEFEKIEQFERVLYLDTDVLINGSLSEVFSEALEDGKIHCLAEGSLGDPREFYGRTLFQEAGLEQLLEKKGFTSGAIIFKKQKSISELFHEVCRFHKTETDKGRILPCVDQPFLNFIATSSDRIDLKILGKYMRNNPTSAAERVCINHFPGRVGNFDSKFSKMSKFFLEIVRCRLPTHLWRILCNRIFLSNSDNGEYLVKIDERLYVAELSDRTRGLIIASPDHDRGLFLTIPSFEVLGASLGKDIASLEIPKAQPRKTLDNAFVNELCDISDSRSGDKQLVEIDIAAIENSVRKFLDYSLSREGLRMWEGGTVNGTEFSTLISLAGEASEISGPIIEIGTLFGFSTNALAIGKAPHDLLITVDAFNWNPIGLPSWRHEELTRKNLAYLVERRNVRIVKALSHEFFETYNGAQPSLVFIDADHRYEFVSKDINLARRIGSKIICGHDFSWPGVRQAVEESFGQDYKVVGDLWIHYLQD